ncbi:MAG: GntR family transcriptional regulator [Buchananella hordeovulneris]|nr:GntR family transcriptional regulator [Buchananella hordeovulneris]
MLSDNLAASDVGDVAKLLSRVIVSDQKQPQATIRSQATMDAIKAYILKEGLKPGDPLPTEAELGAMLDVSRSSVREALRKLEALDIVEVKRGSGSFVGSLSLGPMVETQVLRAAMSSDDNHGFLREVVRARRALDRGLAAEVVQAHHDRPDPELTELVRRMGDLSRAGQQFMDDDIAFHRRLLSPLQSPLIEQTYAAFWLVHMSIVPQLGPGIEEGLRRTALAHGRMLSAAIVGDVDEYLEAVDNHYRPLLELLEQ